MGRTELFVHAFWATWTRQQSIAPALEMRLHGAIRRKCLELKCTPVAVGGTEDHVHLVARLHPTVPVCRLVGEAKGISSFLMNRQIAPDGRFRWQDCYGAVTVNPDDLDRVARYVLNQRDHHLRQQLFYEFEPYG
jgi:REP-associated tyrosine transposase